jgi:hypothetical protein
MSAAIAIQIRPQAGAGAITDVKALTDRELLSACIGNEPRAWRELHRRYDASLRGTAYKNLGQGLVDRLPSDWRDDVMGDFWLKLVERDMAPLRSFDWEKGTAIYKWFARLVCQCAFDYAGNILDQPEFVPVSDAYGVPDEGGVLASGRERMRGSLSARVRRMNAQEARDEKAQARKRVYQARKRRRSAAKARA